MYFVLHCNLVSYLTMPVDCITKPIEYPRIYSLIIKRFVFYSFSKEHRSEFILNIHLQLVSENLNGCWAISISVELTSTFWYDELYK